MSELIQLLRPKPPFPIPPRVVSVVHLIAPDSDEEGNLSCTDCGRNNLTIDDFYLRNGSPRPQCKKCHQARRNNDRRKATMTTTNWFPPSIKPVHVDVYNTSLNPLHKEDGSYQHWNGESWGVACDTQREAISLANRGVRRASIFQENYWRVCTEPQQ